METDTEKTIVVFRKWNTGNSVQDGGIIALFPGIDEGDYRADDGDIRDLCLSYEHIGQHGGADYRHVMKKTVKASAKEFADLKAEIEGIGYNLKVQTRR